MADAKRGGEGGGERNAPIPLSLSLPPYPLSMPATQARTTRVQFDIHVNMSETLVHYLTNGAEMLSNLELSLYSIKL